MGWLKNLLGNDPSSRLAKAEQLLEQGDARRALQIAGQIGDTNPRAEELIRGAHQALLDQALDGARRARESEYWDDVAEWLQDALEHCRDDHQRQELEQQHSDAINRQREDERLVLAASETPEVAAAPELELHPDDHFDALVSMFEDDVAELYHSQGDDFRDAFLQLHGGETASALETLEALCAADPEAAALRLERGRARLVADDAVGAAEDFAVAWQTLGEDPLDRGGQLSIPALWAEAMLAQGQPQPVLERLAPLAPPHLGRTDLCQLYGAALSSSGQLEDARDYLTAASQRFGGTDLTLQLAMICEAAGDRDAAIQNLESSTAASCQSGNCAKPPKHPPSLRLLISLYLATGDSLTRLPELFAHLGDALDGQWDPQDHRMIEEYNRQLTTGDADLPTLEV